MVINVIVMRPYVRNSELWRRSYEETAVKSVIHFLCSIVEQLPSKSAVSLLPPSHSRSLSLVLSQHFNECRRVPILCRETEMLLRWKEVREEGMTAMVISTHEDWLVLGLRLRLPPLVGPAVFPLPGITCFQLWSSGPCARSVNRFPPVQGKLSLKARLVDT